MKQKEIIARLKAGAYITDHSYGRDRRRVSLICETEKYYITEEYKLTLRQVEALFAKGIIRENPEHRKIIQDKYGNWEYFSYYHFVNSEK